MKITTTKKTVKTANKLTLTITIAVIVAATLALTGCDAISSLFNRDPNQNNQNNQNNQSPVDTKLLDINHPVIEGISNDEIPDSIIWGWYTAIDNLSDMEAFSENMIYEPFPLSNYPDNQKSSLPYWILAGPRESVGARQLYNEHPQLSWMTIAFNTTESGGYDQVPYKIEGNRLYIAYNFDPNKPADEQEIDWGYEMSFYFEGRDLVLTRNGAEVRMIPYDFREESTSRGVSGWVSDDENAYNGVISVTYRENEDGSVLRSEIDLTGGWRALDPVFNFADDGTLTMSWEEEFANSRGVIDKKVSLSCRYIWSRDNGLILIDDGQLYLFQTSTEERRGKLLGEALGDNVSYEDFTEAQLQRLIEMQQNLQQDIQSAFDDTEIEVEIDPTTGLIAMDAAILFGVGEFALSSEGMSYLDEFLDVYAGVILSDAYKGSIAEIIVEGHTDSVGSYEINLTLSENRAQSVLDYCLTRQPALADLMTVRGMSYDNLIYDENGVEDRAASRRVVFRFILQTG